MTLDGLEKSSTGHAVHLRVCCKDWDTVRSTVRFPLDSSGEQTHDTLGCIVDFPALTLGQWTFLQPELDRMGIRYDHVVHEGPNAQWVLQLEHCG